MISKNIEKYFNYSFFYTPSVFAEENLNVSDGMGYVYSRSFLIDRASFRNNLVMLVLDGTLYVEQYGQRHELHSGEFIVMKLSDKHRYYSDKNDTARIFWFHFRGRGCDELMTQAGRYKKLPVLQKDSDNALLSMITDMFEVTKTQADGFEADVSPLIYNAVSHALSQTVKEMLFSPNTPADEIIHKVRSYADDHICESLTLDILSAAAGVNKYYLCRVFKEKLGISPMAYVTRKKVELSKKMLENTVSSIASVSDTLGFADQSHFSKSFKAMTGLVPSKYRKMLIK